MAANVGELLVERCLSDPERSEEPTSFESLRERVGELDGPPKPHHIEIPAVDIGRYDELLEVGHV